MRRPPFSPLSLLTALLLLLSSSYARADGESSPWSLGDALKDLFLWLWTLFQGWLAELLPAWLTTDWFGQLWDLFVGLPYIDWVRYGAYLSALDVLAPTVVGAYVVKFLIKRLPVIG